MSFNMVGNKHRNLLYFSVSLLLVLQIFSFVFISAQVSKIDAKITSENKKIKETLTEDFNVKIAEYNLIYRGEFNRISSSLENQKSEQESFKEQINLLKSTNSDFSGVVEDSIKGVVCVITDKSVGTGFVLVSGVIVTNYHVIDGAKRIVVVNHQKKQYEAQVLSSSQTKDLSLLKADLKEGEYNGLELGDSDSLQVGRKVIAIGNPLGLSFSVTEGIISALHREGPNGLEEYVQTDVSLNPGNSGGPLIDSSGKVIGINNFKVGDAESLGFALESNSIKEFLNELKVS